MTTAGSIEGFIREALRAQVRAAGLQDEDVHPELNLLTAGILDSLGFLGLAARLESEFHVSLDFSSADPEEFATLAGLARAVATTLSST